MKPLKTIIVEDEAISRMALSDMVAEVPWLRKVGEADCVSQAIGITEATQPDVMFLDVKIPGGSGFDVLQKISNMPAVVFTTAYRDFAADAFDINAVDYLLKPFSQQRFNTALDRLNTRLAEREQPALTGIESLMVRTGDRIQPVQLSDIDYLQADGDYVAARGQGLNQLMSTNLSALEQELDADIFVRIHRSLIVNRLNIRFLRREGDRRLRLFMRGGDELLSSRAGTKRLSPFIRS